MRSVHESTTGQLTGEYDFGGIQTLDGPFIGVFLLTSLWVN